MQSCCNTPAPMWMYLASVWWLGEPADRRSSIALGIGLAGIAILIIGGWQDAQLRVVAIALGSGITYAGVIVCLRILRNSSSRWLTVLNHLTGALVLLPLAYFQPRPTGSQLVCLFLFGTVQMGLPYWLVAHGPAENQPPRGRHNHPAGAPPEPRMGVPGGFRTADPIHTSWEVSSFSAHCCGDTGPGELGGRRKHLLRLSRDRDGCRSYFTKQLNRTDDVISKYDPGQTLDWLAISDHGVDPACVALWC